MQNVLIEVERYKRQYCGGSETVYYTRLKELQYEEDWAIKEKMTIANGFWRETIFLWNKVANTACFLYAQTDRHMSELLSWLWLLMKLNSHWYCGMRVCGSSSTCCNIIHSALSFDVAAVVHLGWQILICLGKCFVPAESDCSYRYLSFYALQFGDTQAVQVCQGA